MSAVILEDFVKSFIKKPLTEKQTHYVMRFVVAIFGAICVCLVFLVEKLGAVLQLSISLGAVSNGPLLGIFSIGVLLPWISGTSVLVGGASGLAGDLNSTNFILAVYFLIEFYACSYGMDLYSCSGSYRNR